MNPIDKKFFNRIGTNINDDVLSAISNDELYSLLFERLISICYELETQAKHHVNSNEDLISACISLALNQGSTFQAANEAFCNGKVDITVTAMTVTDKSNFCCLGEAKIWDGQSYVSKGLKQLERYSTGRHGNAFMLYYFKTPNCDDKFREFIASFSSEVGTKNFIMHNNRHATTSHTHSSGAIININHFAVNLFYSKE